MVSVSSWSEEVKRLNRPLPEGGLFGASGGAFGVFGVFEAFKAFEAIEVIEASAWSEVLAVWYMVSVSPCSEGAMGLERPLPEGGLFDESDAMFGVSATRQARLANFSTALRA